MDRRQPIMFGMASADQNYKLLQYISDDALSRLPLTDFQIERYNTRLDWDILSNKELSGKTMISFANKINWSVFLTNGKKKDLSALHSLEHKLETYRHIFFDNHIKMSYYNKDFMLIFPQYVDWNWCAKNIKIDDYVLLKYWDKFNIDILSKYQPMSDIVQNEKKYAIKWKVASKWHVSEKLLSEIKNLINWSTKCKRQQLSEQFLNDNFEVLDIKQICRYQKLSETFIEQHMKKLNMDIIAKYQHLSIDFIKKYKNVLSFTELSSNAHYNKADTLQILSNGVSWFVIDPAPVEEFTKINFISS